MDQRVENQLPDLRRYIDARGWTAVEYVDRGVSGAKDKRPALDRLLADANRAFGVRLAVVTLLVEPAIASEHVSEHAERAVECRDG
jgi:DNA invertase Pin-like site-specific DNA recombinase